jgi:hypothetical protein
MPADLERLHRYMLEIEVWTPSRTGHLHLDTLVCRWGFEYPHASCLSQPAPAGLFWTPPIRGRGGGRDWLGGQSRTEAAN